MSNIPGPINITWEKCTEFWSTKQQPSIHFNNMIYAQIGVTPAYGPPVDTWSTVDTKPWGIPGSTSADGPAKYVLLNGIIGITHGTTPETGDLKVYFRAYGSTASVNPPDFSYIGQNACGLVGDGVRSNMMCVVPLSSDGLLDWAWSVPTTPGWPTYCSFLVNLGPQGWWR